jgi:hypothetical protein
MIGARSLEIYFRLDRRIGVLVGEDEIKDTGGWDTGT